jgi:hypothetical protein
MATKKQYFYFIDTHSAGEKLAIVQKAVNAVTRNGWSSNYATVQTTGTNNVRIRGSFLDADLGNDTMTGTYSNIPARFHEAIVSKVIARGYKDPRHMEIQTSQFFDNEYEMGIKRAKKFSKGNYITMGRVVPQDF